MTSSSKLRRPALAAAVCTFVACASTSGTFVSKQEFKSGPASPECDHHSLLSCEQQKSDYDRLHALSGECDRLGQIKLGLGVGGDVAPALAGGLAIAAAFSDYHSDTTKDNTLKLGLALSSGAVGVVGAVLLSVKDIYESRAEDACVKVPKDWRDAEPGHQ